MAVLSQIAPYLSRFLRLAVPFVAISMTILLIFFRDYLQQAPAFGYAGIFVVSIIGSASVILPTPTLLIVAGSGTVLNANITGVIAAFGTTIGDLSSYALGITGQSMVKDNRFYNRLEQWLRHYGWIVLFK